MRKKKTVLAFGAWFWLSGGLAVLAQAPFQDLDKSEALRREIRVINLLNGLELTPEQMTLIRDKAEESRRLVDEARASYALRQKELGSLLEDIRKYRLENQDIPGELAGRFHALDMELKKEKLRLDETLRGYAGDVERSLSRHQVYALEKFIPCIIPPKGESRIGQAADVKGIGGKLARLRTIPERVYELRREEIIERNLQERRIVIGPAAASAGDGELAGELGRFYDKTRDLSQVDFEVQKEKLAQEFATLLKPKAPALDLTKKIEAFLLSPEVIPVLNERLQTARTSR
jgi:hypothetical protein